MFKIRFGLIIAVIVLLSGMVLAQDSTDINVDRNTNTDTWQTDQQLDQTDNKTTQAWTDDLRTRLNLTDDQVTQVSDIMTRYQRESDSFRNDTPETQNYSKDELQQRYSTEIEGILDDTQKSQWQSYSTTWWNTVNTTSGKTDVDQIDSFKKDKQQDRDTQGDFEIQRDSEADTSDIR